MTLRNARRAVLAVAALALLTAVGASAGRSSAWPQHLVAAENLNVSTQVVADGELYELLSQTLTPTRGPYRLRRRDLRSGAVRTGPLVFGNYNYTNSLVFASGHLWIDGVRASRPTLIEVDPRTLHIVRSMEFPKDPTPYPWIAITAGPDHSVWVGTSHTLRRVDVATGKTITTVPGPTGFAVGDLSVDPSGAHLYVSAAHVVKGGLEGNAVFEYDADSGRRLAAATTGVVTYSVGGAALTAVPGGVWASFRTGMLGLTIHLRQSDLALRSPPGKAIAKSPANGLFHWPMSASTIYGGGSLWIANESGFIACLDPQTATVRASERIPQSEAPSIVGIDSNAHALYIVGATGRGVIEVTTPAGCRR